MTSMNQNDNQFENKFMNVVKCLLLTYLIKDLGIFNGRFHTMGCMSMFSRILYQFSCFSNNKSALKPPFLSN